MCRVGRPRTRPEANLNVNFEHVRGSEQSIDIEAESHPNPPRPQPQEQEPRDETIDRINQLLTTIVQHQTHVPEITIERARKVGATSFDGSRDLDSAHAWLNDLEQNLVAVSWNEFKRLFNAHFYPMGGSSSKLPRAENYLRPTTSFQQKYVLDSSQASVKQPLGGRQQSGSVGRVRYPPYQKCGKDYKG
ncbi:hypothetical protein JRO89_XS06G0205000 [Xanthoceras sorbifolium]|uniref:Retrotransposon gag domain-containing protein n=1 Tax=Xanthoceras sorbifolium TaxID=99658 RepID=A0ABQ8HYZ3_9ROSI|nr:hypothetical protein JRO89_XS06G0205000 [Xanthoceras sorbifolium]